jgi:hypothetical protein
MADMYISTIGRRTAEPVDSFDDVLRQRLGNL